MNQMLENLMNRVRLMVGRCIIVATKYESGDLNVDVELTAGEKRRNLEFLQQYGLISRPVGDVSGLALFVGGNRANGVVVACNGDESAMKKKLEPGEVCLVSPHGQQVYLKKDGSIALVSGNGIVTVDGKLQVSQDIVSGGAVQAKMDVVAFNGLPNRVGLSTHIHPIAVGPSGVGPSNPPTPGT